MYRKITHIIKSNVSKLYEDRIGNFFFKQKGYCPCCKQETLFIARNSWLRDHFKCEHCQCIPRERALMLTIDKEYPNWESFHIHESSPSNRGHSFRLKKHSKKYLETQYFPDTPLGTTVNGVQNEDLEQQTFKDNSFDLVITSDVMEHVYDPKRAFQEIHRTLKPGGAHIFSVPLINRFEKTVRWAEKGDDGEPIFLFQPEWHGNPVNKKGSPVTMHWGYDIINFIRECTGADCKIVYHDDLHHGIRAEFREIIVAKKKN